MSYIEQSLGENEVVIRKARFPWPYYAAAWGALVLLFAAAVFLLERHQPVWLVSTAAAVGLVVFLIIMVPVWTTEIGVTSQRLIVKRGFVTRRSDELELWAIEEVSLEQGLMGRLLGFGRIKAQGTGDDELEIPAIADPLRFRKAIQDAIGRARPSHPGSEVDHPRPRGHGRPARHS
jgi:uncharacterized membrane protein YdbT with pleckstrin-like domain